MLFQRPNVHPPPGRPQFSVPPEYFGGIFGLQIISEYVTVMDRNTLHMGRNAMNPSGYQPKYPVQTLQKSMDVLLYMVNHPSPEGLTITEISAHTGISKSGVHRILDTFLSYRIVEKLESAQTYRLGWGLYELGLAVPSTNSLLSTDYADIMSDLCHQLSETINLGIRSEDEVVIIHKREPQSRFHASTVVGDREPLHATSLGKVFLSALTNDEVREYYATHKIVRMTENSIMTAEAMIPELVRTRKLGYAMDCEEFEPDLICVAMPIWDYTGKIAAAMSVSGPSSHMTETYMELVIQELRKAVNKISASLGYTESIQKKLPV